MHDSSYLPSARVLSVAAILFFVPVALSFALAPRAWWVNYLGICFHLSLFLLVPLLSAPSWAKAAGYAWLTLDVLSSVLSINGIPDSLAQPVRLAGHLFAGFWIVTASLGGSRAVKLVGMIAGAWLFSFTFVSPHFPISALGPASIAILIWLAIIAVQNGTQKIAPASMAR